MLIAVIADPHANLEALTAVLDALDKRRPDQTVCLGDLTGYYTNPNEVVELVRARKIQILMGNHDAAVCDLEEPIFFNSAAKKVVEWQLTEIRKRNQQWLAQAPEQITLDGTCLGVHGSPRGRDEYIGDWLDAMQQMPALHERGATVCFFGHTHRASFFCEHGDLPRPDVTTGVVRLRRGDRYLINPGAVGQPRDHDPRAAFGLFDSEKLTFEFCRVEYDIDACCRKMVEAGLPMELCKRLKKGK